MIAIILTVCLATSPDVCHEESPPIAVISEQQCKIQGQQIAAELQKNPPHGGYNVQVPSGNTVIGSIRLSWPPRPT